MKPQRAPKPEDIKKMFRSHDEATASFRAELAQRSAGEVLFGNSQASKQVSKPPSGPTPQ